MHPYSIDSEERRRALGILGIISVVIAYAVYLTLNAIQITTPWYISLPSPLAVYAPLFYALDRYLWKIPAVRWILRLQSPDLNGEWDGEIRSSYHNHNNSISASMEVYQTWSTIEVILRAEESNSYSYSAAIRTDQSNETFFTYSYSNEPEPDANPGMEIHLGTAHLTIRDGDDSDLSLTGRYYTGRGRNTYGKMQFERVAEDV